MKVKKSFYYETFQAYMNIEQCVGPNVPINALYLQQFPSNHKTPDPRSDSQRAYLAPVQGIQMRALNTKAFSPSNSKSLI